jgi:hypothetical protein
MRRPNTPALALALLPALAGCVDAIAAREAELAPLVGKSELDLVRQLGVPTRTTETGGRKFLAYVEDRSQLLPGLRPVGPWGAYGYPMGGFQGVSPEIVPRACETTFELEGGVVRAFALHGDGCD